MIYVTQHIIDKNEELLPVFRRLNKTEYVVRTEARIAYLKEIQRTQENKQPIQLSLF